MPERLRHHAAECRFDSCPIVQSLHPEETYLKHPDATYVKYNGNVYMKRVKFQAGQASVDWVLFTEHQGNRMCQEPSPHYLEVLDAAHDDPRTAVSLWHAYYGGHPEERKHY